MGLFGKSYDTIEKARAASRMTMGFVGDGHSALESRGESPHGRLRRSVRVKPDGISATANRGARSRTQYRPVQIAGAESYGISTCAELSVAQVDFRPTFPPVRPRRQPARHAVRNPHGADAFGRHDPLRQEIATSSNLVLDFWSQMPKNI